MGVSLSLIGAGGSILTIPILVYLLDTPIVKATTYSLVIVGCSALIACISYRKHIIFYKALLLTLPSIIGVFVSRFYIIPNLPKSFGIVSIEKILIILLLIFIGVAGYFMVNDFNSDDHYSVKSHTDKKMTIILIGLCLGGLTGLLGAGGGFLIIPTLVLLMKFTMQEVIPTSLFIITVNSLIGFAADKVQLLSTDWLELSKYLGCTFLGIYIGIYIAKFIKSKNLKTVFGYFIWIIGIGILMQEFIL
ncbi:MAG: sulfite exporter TauE/SafE family protein [Rickettsiaceae bacterium]|nr:sulfite exporter TauE/SafE family protein [Rickettsiaceae bacterium]